MDTGISAELSGPSRGQARTGAWRDQAGKVAARLLSAVPMTLVAVCATVAVMVFQVRDRAPLLWDEAVRVSAGWDLSWYLKAGDSAGAWRWLNDQTFYPFLASTPYGVLQALGVDPLTAAWIPGVVAYGLTGLLVARLVREMGGGRLAALAGAAGFWLVPLSARFAAGAFTEPIGALGFTALAVLLVRLVRAPEPKVAVLGGLVIALLSWVKWDYGLIGMAALMLGAVVATRGDSSPRSVRMHQWAMLVALLLIGALLKQNLARKLAGVGYYVGSNNFGGSIDPSFYLRAFFTELGLWPLLAAVLLAGAVLGVSLWSSRREVRPLVLLVSISYLVYTVENNLQARYLVPELPLVAALAGLGLGSAHSRFKGHLERLRGQVDLPGYAVPAAGIVLALLVVGGQLPGLSEKLDFMMPATDAAQAQTFFGTNLTAGSMGAAYIGATNEVSPESIRVAAEQWSGTAAPRVDYIYQTNPGNRAATFEVALSQHQGGQLLAMTITPGSRLDSHDYHAFGPDRPGSDTAYFDFALRMEAGGCLQRVAQETTHPGKMLLAVWQIPTGVDFTKCGV